MVRSAELPKNKEFDCRGSRTLLVDGPRYAPERVLTSRNEAMEQGGVFGSWDMTIAPRTHSKRLYLRKHEKDFSDATQSYPNRRRHFTGGDVHDCRIQPRSGGRRICLGQVLWVQSADRLFHGRFRQLLRPQKHGQQQTANRSNQETCRTETGSEKSSANPIHRNPIR